MKKLTFLFCIFFTISLTAQVDSVKYVLEHNCETAQYDVKLFVAGGSAKTVIERAQFNSQISLVVPTGLQVEIGEKYFPLQNNSNYEGTVPMNWVNGSIAINPSVMPGYDLFNVLPTLSPASFYNDLEENSETLLFSFTAGDSEIYNPEIRFYDNENDPPNPGGGDFRNGFAIGNSEQKYIGNIYRSCITSTEKEILENVKIFPNPISSILNIDSPQNIESIEVVNVHGQVMDIITPGIEKLNLDASHYPAGVYYVVMRVAGNLKTTRILKL